MKKIILVWFFCTVGLFAMNNMQDDRLKAFKESLSEESIGNYDSALELMWQLSKKYTNDYLVMLRMGWLNYLLKDYDASYKYYKEAVRLSDSSIEALLGLTYPLSAQEKWDEITTIYKQIIDEDEYNYTANLNLGQIYLNNKNYLNAKIVLEKVYELYPSDYDINLYLGWTYYYLGNKSKARSLFENALIMNSSSTSAIEGLNLVR